MTTDINLFDTVRSFDFDRRDVTGPRACYVEGRVVGFADLEGCPRYAIFVTRRVFRGEERPVDAREQHVYPPVNGTPTLMGETCNGVERVEVAS